LCLLCKLMLLLLHPLLLLYVLLLKLLLLLLPLLSLLLMELLCLILVLLLNAWLICSLSLRRNLLRLYLNRALHNRLLVAHIGSMSRCCWSIGLLLMRCRHACREIASRVRVLVPLLKVPLQSLSGSLSHVLQMLNLSCDESKWYSVTTYETFRAGVQAEILQAIVLCARGVRGKNVTFERFQSGEVITVSLLLVLHLSSNAHFLWSICRRNTIITQAEHVQRSQDTVYMTEN